MANIITLENVRMIFENFAGKEKTYNAKGVRNFHIILDEPTAAQLANDGFNVRRLKPQEEGELGTPILKVNVNFESNNPPQVAMITGRGRTNLDSSTVDILDWMEIETADVMINPYVREWGDGRVTTTAYLHKLFVKVVEDELDVKYANVPIIGEETRGGPRFVEDED